MELSALVMASIALAAPRWVERDGAQRRVWATERDAEARAWVSDDGALEAVAGAMARARAEAKPHTYVADHQGGATLWVALERLTDEDDLRRTEWAARIWREDAEGKTHPITAGDDAHLLCASTLSPDGLTAFVGRLAPLPDGAPLDETRVCTVYRVDQRGVVEVFAGEQLTVTAEDAGTAWIGEHRGRRQRLHRLLADGRVTPAGTTRAHGFGQRDGRWVGWNDRRVWVGDAPDAWRRWGRVRGLAGVVSLTDDALLMRSALRASNGEVVRVARDARRPARWRSLVAERPGAVLVQCAHIGDRLLSVWARDGLMTLEQQPLEGGPSRPVPLGGPWTHLALRRTWSGTPLLMKDSPVARTVDLLRLDGAWVSTTPLIEEVKEGLDFVALTLPTPDGEVPVSLVVPEGDAHPRPVVLSVYGGFGQSQRLFLGPVDELFLEAGASVGVIHARGGRERGEAWHESAMKEHLGRTIDDVDAAVAGLGDLGWATPGRVALMGSSNGGLTVAASVARAPERYGAAVVHAGVLDLLRGPRWGRYWWPEEYGRPRGEQRAVLEALSPRHNAPHVAPPTLVATGAHDPVVPPTHSYALAQAWSGVAGGPVLLKVDGHGSHGGRRRDRDAMTRSAPRAASAETGAFLFRALDLPLPAPPPNDGHGEERPQPQAAPPPARGAAAPTEDR